MTLTSLELALLACLALAIGAAAALALARRGGPAAEPSLGDALAGRLDMMARTQEAAKAELAQQLQAQERTLGEAVAKRLAELQGKVGESLEKSAKDTSATVTALRERLIQIDAAQKSLADLSSHVVGLRDILSNKQARGAFGEVMLEDLVKEALPPKVYEFQKTLSNGKRADCLLIQPYPPGPIVIDAKFPLEAWRALGAAADEVQRKQADRAFDIAVSKHILDIQERYIIPNETADSALMFLPSEAVYAELHANHADLLQKSYRARVFIVSPTTLWATLHTIRAVLRDVEMRREANKIQIEVGKLYVDVERLDARAENLEKHFAQAEKDVREIRISAGKVQKRGAEIRDVELGENRDAVGALAGPPSREI